MQQIADEALAVQSACNLSGVVHAFSRMISDVRTHLESQNKSSTDNVNKHPACILFATQIAFLTGISKSGCEDANLYARAYKWATQQSQSESLIDWRYE